MIHMSAYEYLNRPETKKMVKAHKYNAKKTIVDGITFPSKLEASYYTLLKSKKTIGTISYFLRQVPFSLPGNTKYLVDFMVVYLDGTIEYIDVKGKSTPMATLKIKQVEALYPVEIKIVSKV